jgi:hypothetical protein
VVYPGDRLILEQWRLIREQMKLILELLRGIILQAMEPYPEALSLILEPCMVNAWQQRRVNLELWINTLEK